MDHPSPRHQREQGNLLYAGRGLGEIEIEIEIDPIVYQGRHRSRGLGKIDPILYAGSIRRSRPYRQPQRVFQSVPSEEPCNSHRTFFGIKTTVYYSENA